MIPVVSRLVLSNGQQLESGAEWPEDEKFVVGPIFFIRESTEIFRNSDEGGDSGESSDTTPACYEVWQVPADFLQAMYQGKFDFVEQSGMLQKIPALKCIRVWISGNLLFAEERWPTEQAAIMISDRFKDQLTDAGLLAVEPSAPQLQQQASA